MWLAMTVAMMTPTTMNWLFAFTDLASRSDPRRTFRAVGAFVAGYFFVWLGYSILAAVLQIRLQHANFLDRSGKLPSSAAGVVLMGAGIVYFTPLSRACLRHCRNPLTYFLAHWDNGPHGGFRFGVAHGAYCVGCCWSLMLTGFAMGVMNIVWMGFLTILVCVEKLATRGDRIAGVVATALIVWGAALLL
jgi:predicted metal-binding membrane protein